MRLMLHLCQQLLAKLVKARKLGFLRGNHFGCTPLILRAGTRRSLFCQITNIFPYCSYVLVELRKCQKIAHCRAPRESFKI